MTRLELMVLLEMLYPQQEGGIVLFCPCQTAPPSVECRLDLKDALLRGPGSRMLGGLSL